MSMNNSNNEINTTNIINILSSESPLVKYHQQRYKLELEKKIKGSLKARRKHIKNQKAAYKRLYPSLQRTSVVLRLMKTIEHLENSNYKPVVPSNNLTQFIPEQFSVWENNNISKSSQLTNFKRNQEVNYSYNTIDNRHEEKKNTI